MPRKLSPDKLVLRLFDATSTPIYLLDRGQCMAYANPACAAWLGEQVEQLLGRQCSYQAVAEETSQQAPSLAPPPETAAGQVATGFVAAPADGGKVRECRFQPLAMGDAGEAYLLAIVSGEPVSSLEIESAEVGASDARRLHAQLLELRGAWKKRFRSAPFLGVSAASQRIRSQIALAAGRAKRVLVLGPTGSGRQHVARAIHFNQPGEPGAFVRVDCRLLDAELMQQTLATFLKKHPAQKPRQAALLLSEVDRLSDSAQQELIEFLRLPGIDLTIHATAGRSLKRLARKGRFRADLAQALGTLTIEVPPLTERREDIPLLAQHFVEQANATSTNAFSGFSVDALDQLAAHSWPENVRELQTLVGECCQRAIGPYITPADLPDRLKHDAFSAAHPPRAMETIQLDDYLAGIERELLQRALAAAKGNKTRAASMLGIHRARLIRRLVQLGLVEPTPVEQASEIIDEGVIFEPHPDES